MLICMAELKEDAKCKTLFLLIINKWWVNIVITMQNECKYWVDEACVNAECPLLGDFCPLRYAPYVCKWEDRSGNNAELYER